MMQRSIEEYSKADDDVVGVGFNVGEAVRNVTFHGVVEPDLGRRQQEVYEIVLAAYPGGVTTRDIQNELSKKYNRRVELHEFSGRLTELANPKGYDDDKHSQYCNPPLIAACSSESVGFDNAGRSRFYTSYRAVVGKSLG